MTFSRIFLAAALLTPTATLAQITSIPVSAPAAEVPETSGRSLLDRLASLEWKGITPTVGTVASGSGPAVGFEFLTTHLGPLTLGLGVDAMISLRNYQDLAVRVGGLSHRSTGLRLEPADNAFTATMDRPTSDAPGWAVYLEHQYRRLPSLSLYGATAPDTTVRTAFGQTTSATDAVFQLQTIRAIGVSARLGLLTTDPFDGPHNDRPHTGTVFSDGITHALTHPSRYLVGGIGVGLDRRDHPWRPKRGSVATLSAWRFLSRADAFTSFSRFGFDFQSFKQVGTLRHVVAARLLGSYTSMTDGREFPFQLTHALGGSDSLRSFPSDRFRGQSLLAATLESRWRTWRPLELVLFLDVGHFQRPPVPTDGGTTLTSLGVGARYWFRDRYALRADVSRGRDGVRLVVTLGAPF